MEGKRAAGRRGEGDARDPWLLAELLLPEHSERALHVDLRGAGDG